MENILEAKDISISFGGVKAVQHLSFDIHKGEILGLIGPNGSGKSTVVNLISGVYKLDTGTIIFDGKEIPHDEGIAARARRGMGRTFQTPKPFSALSVYENVYITALQKHDAKGAAEMTEKILKETELIRYLNQKLGVSLLFIEHVMKAVLQICTRCVVMEEGKLLAEGDPAEVLSRKEVIAAYLGSEEEE